MSLPTDQFLSVTPHRTHKLHTEFHLVSLQSMWATWSHTNMYTLPSHTRISGYRFYIVVAFTFRICAYREWEMHTHSHTHRVWHLVNILLIHYSLDIICILFIDGVDGESLHIIVSAATIAHDKRQTLRMRSIQSYFGWLVYIVRCIPSASFAGKSSQSRMKMDFEWNVCVYESVCVRSFVQKGMRNTTHTSSHTVAGLTTYTIVPPHYKMLRVSAISHTSQWLWWLATFTFGFSGELSQPSALQLPSYDNT